MTNFIPSVEKKLLSWIDKHLYVFWFIVVSVLAGVIRWSFFDHISGDYYTFLQPWYEQIAANGGFSALAEQTGDYNILYQFLIACLTCLPIEPLYAFKILSCLFDYLLAWITARLVGLCMEKDKPLWCALAYSAVLLSPLVFLNSAAWAQCDSIYIFFCIAALYYLLQRKVLPSFILYGVAFSLKLQSIFLLPFFFFIYYREHAFSLLCFLLIPAVMIVTSIPGIVFGRGLFDVFSVYVNQTDTYHYISLNYPSVWLLLYHSSYYWAFQKLHRAAILLCALVQGMHLLCWDKRKVPMTAKNKVCMAFILVYSCVLLLPSMHERYSVLYEILAIVVFCIDRKTGLLLVPLYGISLATYGKFLFGSEFDLNLLAAINTLIYTAYVWLLTRKMISEAEKEIVLV